MQNKFFVQIRTLFLVVFCGIIHNAHAMDHRLEAKSPTGIVSSELLHEVAKNPAMMRDLQMLLGDESMTPDRLNELDGRGLSPFHSAVMADNLYAVKSFIVGGANWKQLTRSGQSPEHLASESPDGKAIKKTLQVLDSFVVIRPDLATHQEVVHEITQKWGLGNFDKGILRLEKKYLSSTSDSDDDGKEADTSDDDYAEVDEFDEHEDLEHAVAAPKKAGYDSDEDYGEVRAFDEDEDLDAPAPSGNASDAGDDARPVSNDDVAVVVVDFDALDI